MRLAVSVVASALLSTLAAPTLDATPRDLDVFNAVLRQAILKGHVSIDVESGGARLVILDRTYRFCDRQRTVWCMPTEDGSPIGDWMRRASADGSLVPEFSSRNRDELRVSNPDPRAGVLVSTDAFEAMSRSDDFWRIFRTQYPDARGFVRFSTPAYTDKGEALVYVTYGCGGLCGEGRIVRLVPGDEGWRVTMSLRLWES